MHLRHTQNGFEMLYTIGANSQYMLLKFPRLRKVSAEFRRKIRHGAKYTRRARLGEHATRVFSMLSYFLAK